MTPMLRVVLVDDQELVRTGFFAYYAEDEARLTKPEEWYEEDTMLGDYLRSVREYQQDTTGKLNLSQFVDHDSSEEVLVAATQFDADQRRDMLRESAMMGVKLLSGTEGR